MTEKTISRGYVKWEDEKGFHKEPLAAHPELLANATPEQQLRAEEVRRMNAAAEEAVEEREDNADEDATDTLEALREAPEDVLTAAQLVGDLDTAEVAPAGAASEEVAEEPIDLTKPLDEREEALAKLREETSE